MQQEGQALNPGRTELRTRIASYPKRSMPEVRRSIKRKGRQNQSGHKYLRVWSSREIRSATVDAMRTRPIESFARYAFPPRTQAQ
jgi:hypothetical protein